MDQYMMYDKAMRIMETVKGMIAIFLTMQDKEAREELLKEIARYTNLANALMQLSNENHE